jgi:hypothetical protein
MSLGDTIAVLLEQNGARLACGEHNHTTSEDSVATGLAQVDYVFTSFAEARDTLHFMETAKPDPSIEGNVLLKAWRGTKATGTMDCTPLGLSGDGVTINWIAIGK